MANGGNPESPFNSSPGALQTYNDCGEMLRSGVIAQETVQMDAATLQAAQAQGLVAGNVQPPAGGGLGQIGMGAGIPGQGGPTQAVQVPIFAPKNLTVLGQHWPTTLVTHYRDPPVALPQDVERELTGKVTTAADYLVGMAQHQQGSLSDQLHATSQTRQLDTTPGEVMTKGHAFVLPFYGEFFEKILNRETTF